MRKRFFLIVSLFSLTVFVYGAGAFAYSTNGNSHARNSIKTSHNGYSFSHKKKHNGVVKSLDCKSLKKTCNKGRCYCESYHIIPFKHYLLSSLKNKDICYGKPKSKFKAKVVVKSSSVRIIHAKKTAKLLVAKRNVVSLTTTLVQSPSKIIALQPKEKFSTALPSTLQENTVPMTVKSAQPTAETVALQPKENISSESYLIAHHKDLIDSMNVPENTKKLLYEYAATTEGQKTFSGFIPATSFGPTAASISTPIGFGSDWGTVSAGLLYSEHLLGTTSKHGIGNVAFGLGDADKYLGLTVSVLVDNIRIDNGNFAKNGTVALHLFHNFPNNTALAIGMANAVPWGIYNNAAKSYYVVGTKVFDVSIRDNLMPLTLSLGLGTGAFYSSSNAQNKNDNQIKPFGSVGWQVFPFVSVIGESVANQVNAGISVVPFKKIPVSFNLAECNLNRTSNQNSYFVASMAIGYAFK